jgi:hypothetical protein
VTIYTKHFMCQIPVENTRLFGSTPGIAFPVRRSRGRREPVGGTAYPLPMQCAGLGRLRQAVGQYRTPMIPPSLPRIFHQRGLRVVCGRPPHWRICCR